ncbi:unnamed protein product [Durusdinium trenchii]|uniref:SMP-30/Gluconolactonase/LRE-like region domain-containing protein n=1 Tax=Durusdinium trenchii TaxID=1381693 RepID=A0ABP0M5K0_9DINO
MAVPVLEAEVAVQLEAGLGEGSIWDSRSKKLIWLDILGVKLFRFDPSSGQNEVFELSGFSTSVSSVVPISSEVDPEGDTVGVTLREGFAIYNFRTRGLHKLGNDPPIKHGERFNDGKVDPRGCYWAGTLARDESSEIISGAATLYCRDLDGSVKAVLTDLSISNGLVWTTDARSMYFIDTPSAQIDRLDFDPSSGTLSNRRPVVKGFDFETTGFPDGCAIDQEDRLWVARFNGGCCGYYDPKSGKLLAEVRVPAEAGKQVTSVAFGGSEMRDLYLTTGREGFDEAKAKQYPLAGSLFVVPAVKLAHISGGVAGQVPNQLKLS